MRGCEYRPRRLCTCVQCLFLLLSFGLLLQFIDADGSEGTEPLLNSVSVTPQREVQDITDSKSYTIEEARQMVEADNRKSLAEKRKDEV